LSGRAFPLLERRNCWGEERVYFHDDTGRLRRLPAAWTDALSPSAFEVVSAGRSAFRIEDLLRLVSFVARQKEAMAVVPRKRNVSSK
jgi:hypothetical protein